MSTSSLPRIASSSDLAADFDLSWLRASADREVQPISPNAPVTRIADLFAGCGGMSLGLREAARALNMRTEFVLGAEMDPVKAEVYRRNFNPSALWTSPVEDLLDGDLGEPATPREAASIASLGGIDILVGGPPCQGHSDLNNHTRRDDVRNGLISRMARAAELLRPTHVIIENVQGARHDRRGSAAMTAAYLRGLGYEVEDALVEFDRLGVPQKRRRYLLVASRTQTPDIKATVEALTTSQRTVSWALADLLSVVRPGIFDSAAVHSPLNRRRIQYLFDQGLHDLPDAERPDCHRFKAHSYTSVYGRMWWEERAPTITTGFGSTGQGRFVHPLVPRTLTPHEAARLQTVPDSFEFGEPGRTQLQKMIGNMVPPLAMAAISIGLLR
ncbi:MAG: DNA cytosine methyltransferase [Brevundimonas sp.]